MFRSSAMKHWEECIKDWTETRIEKNILDPWFYFQEGLSLWRREVPGIFQDFDRFLTFLKIQVLEMQSLLSWTLSF